MRLDPFIEAEKQHGSSIARCCSLFGVSRAAYYQRQHRVPSARARTDAELTIKIRSIHTESQGTYGTPRVTAALCRQGEVVSRRRVGRLMRAEGLEGRAKKRWRTTTIADPDAAATADRIQRRFAPGGPADVRYVGDITYITTGDGWAYLATVIDLATRRVVGWALTDHMRAELVVDALAMAFAQRQPPAGLIFHSDRGSQYSSDVFAALAADHGAVLSVGRKGECWDNAVAESFFATIKRELIDTRAWPSHTALRRAIFEWIEGWYNTRRLHSALGYRTPAEAEANHDHDHQPTTQAA